MAKNKAPKATMKDVSRAITDIYKKVNFLINHSRNMETTLMSYIAFKNDTHKYNEWLKKEIEKQKKEIKNERRDTKDGGRDKTHQASGV